MSIAWISRRIFHPFMYRRSVRLALLLIFVPVLLLSVRILTWQPLETSGALPDDGWVRVNGAIHVHTSYSDGGGSAEEVIETARRIGLRFLMITDHKVLDAKRLEGYHGDVLVLVGSELSTDAGHLLALGISDPVFRFSGNVEDGMSDIRLLNGVPVIAHPMNARPEFRWSRWDLPGPWHLEVVNGDSQWRNTRRLKLAGLLLVYPLNWRYAMLRSMSYPQAELQKWDHLLAQRNIAGISGADAHSRIRVTRDRSVRFPSYEALLSLVQNHVLLREPLSGNAEEDGRNILQAISEGRLYVGADGLAPANDFYFTAEQRDQTWTMGESLSAGSDTFTLRAGGRLPDNARIRLLRNGVPVEDTAESLERSFHETGIYRIEVRVAGWDLPWVISNPIYVFGTNTLEERRLRSQWPVPNAPPRAARLLDSFDGKTGFVPESDPLSVVRVGMSETTAETGEVSAVQMGFDLGIPKADPAGVFCALVDRRNRDFSTSRGLLVRLKADGMYRIWVQVRDENASAGKEGVESWFASIRTSTEWETVAVPFAKLRSIDPSTDGRLDLDQVKAVVFLLDAKSVKPGTSGTIWIDHLSAY